MIAKDFVERFLKTLPLKDRQIVELRQDGFTYEEIADKLGYKNHSGVIKRVEAVKRNFKSTDAAYESHADQKVVRGFFALKPDEKR